MRKLRKRHCPPVLTKRATEWQAAYDADPKNNTHKFKYRHEDIKAELRKETAWKCVYCESAVGHDAPGDVEHKVPSAVDPSQRFTWENLTVACTECNRRKNSTYDPTEGFLDPYCDDVEDLVRHHGPIVTWKPGSIKAETAIRILELHGYTRSALVEQKIHHLNSMAHLVERFHKEPNATLKDCLRREIEAAKSKDAKYSAMTIAFVKTVGV